MTPATLRDFLLTGMLGPIRPGLSFDEVRVRLGDPEDVSVSQNPKIWKYGSLQLSFCEGEQNSGEALDGIGLYFHHDPFSLPLTIPLSGWWPQFGTKLVEFEQQLRAMNVPYGIDTRLTWPDSQITLRTSFGVGICFAVDDGEPVLDSVIWAGALT